MMANVHRSLGCVALLLGLTWSFVVRADEPANVTQAREIALNAGDDVDAGRFQDALDKIVQAEALYHAPTHLLIRAEALEGLGQLVEALDTYENLAAEPLSPTAPPAFREARDMGRKRQIALIARVPSVLVLLSGADAATIPTATLDGRPMSLTTDQATRCNPGKHVLRVEAKGYRTVEQTLDLPDRGGVIKLKLQLEKEVETTNVAPPPPPRPVPKGPSLFLPAVISVGVGGLSLAAGAATGGLSLTQVRSLERECRADGSCPPTLEATMNRARLLGNVSTATFIVGGVAVSAGVVMLVMGKRKAPAAGSLQAIPWVAPGMAGLRGEF